MLLDSPKWFVQTENVSFREQLTNRDVRHMSEEKLDGKINTPETIEIEDKTLLLK